jgi:hypothetical protein
MSLGAGLDARPYRMSLPPALRWIEADFARIIEYKETQLRGAQPHCQLERVKVDLTQRNERRQLLARVDAQASCALVLTEGVIAYLANNEVATLAEELRAMQHARFWILDYACSAATNLGPLDLASEAGIFPEIRGLRAARADRTLSRHKQNGGCRSPRDYHIRPLLGFQLRPDLASLVRRAMHIDVKIAGLEALVLVFRQLGTRRYHPFVSAFLFQ